MIRFLICLECLLLTILALGRLELSSSPAEPGQRPKAAAAAAPATAGATAATSAGAAGAMRHDDRVALARDLLGSVGGSPPLAAPAGAVAGEDGGTAAGASVAGGTPAALPAHGGAAQGGTAHGGTAHGGAADGRGVDGRGVEGGAVAVEMAGATAGTTVGATPRGQDQDGPAAQAAGEPRSSARVAAVQRLLGQLGFRPGAPDGALGPRTEQAIRAYQQRAGERVDGRVSDRLLARLQRDARRIAGRIPNAGRDRATGQSPGSDRPAGVLATILGGYQRLVGHQFDSVRRPGELRAYCRSQPDSWIYDEGSRDLRYCGRIAPNRDG